MTNSLGENKCNVSGIFVEELKGKRKKLKSEKLISSPLRAKSSARSTLRRRKITLRIVINLLTSAGRSTDLEAFLR